MTQQDAVAVLAGGVGAARFLRGLVGVTDPASITAIVNTGDDTELHGLSISPDIDTVTYTLAGAIDQGRGWGLTGETWDAMGALSRYEHVRPAGSSAASTWFNLGDRDLATHLYRTARLDEGATLTDVTGEISRAWGLDTAILPMTDGRFRTLVTLGTGEEISFQDYFVRLRHSVPVRAIRFDRGDAELSSAARRALEGSDRIVIAPSNPLVSIAPIRALPGTDDLLSRRRDRTIAISPIVGGATLKGPADRMLTELGFEPSVIGVAKLYADVASALIIDPVDESLAGAVEAAGMRCVVHPSVMSSPEASQSLAATALATPPTP